MTDPNDAPGPTQADRLRLARAHQARALRRPDPLHATIGLLVGDVVIVTNQLREAALTEAADGPAPAGASPLPCLSMWMKGVNQVSKLTTLERRLAAGPGVDPPAPASEDRAV